MTADDLLTRIHDANQSEVAAGQLAEERATSDKVKKFGQEMVRDHNRADKLVMDLAHKKNVEVDSTLPKSAGETGQLTRQASESAELKMTSGEEFDRKFIAWMKSDHQKMIGLLESADVDDSDVKKLVAKLLPELKEHEKAASRLDSQVREAR